MSSKNQSSSRVPPTESESETSLELQLQPSESQEDALAPGECPSRVMPFGDTSPRTSCEYLGNSDGSTHSFLREYMEEERNIRVALGLHDPNAPFIHAVSSLETYPTAVDSTTSMDDNQRSSASRSVNNIYPRPSGALFNPKTTKSEVKQRSVPSYLENIIKKEHVKEVLSNEQTEAPKETSEELDSARKFFERSPESSDPLEILRSQPRYQVAGKKSSQTEIGNAGLLSAIDGVANMNLAHEIAINQDFRLEAYNPPCHGIEEQVRIQMKKAYWDIFDEAIASVEPKPGYILGVFREVSQLIVRLLMAHNIHMKKRIEEFLDEEIIVYEIQHHIMDYEKYAKFIIETLRQICCPVRDRQIDALKDFAKPSDAYKGILDVMADMQLDMTNFYISQIRPVIVENCVKYERSKFAELMEIQYKQVAGTEVDPIANTRSWISKHATDSPSNEVMIGNAYAELLNWSNDEWPETMTMDYKRYASLNDDIRRATFVGAAVLTTFATFQELVASATPDALPCLQLRETLALNLSVIIQKEDCVSQESVKYVMDLVGEQSVKLCNDFLKKNQRPEMNPQQKNRIILAVRDCADSDYHIRMILVRRILDYASAVITAGKVESVPFPKGLVAIQESVLKAIVEFSRLAAHNRAVFEDLYIGIATGDVPAPGVMDENEEFDLSMLAVLKCFASSPPPSESNHSQDLPNSERTLEPKLDKERKRDKC